MTVQVQVVRCSVVASVGDLIDRRYKVIRIEAEKATLEDTQFEKEQAIPIERSPDSPQ